MSLISHISCEAPSFNFSSSLRAENEAFRAKKPKIIWPIKKFYLTLPHIFNHAP